jgi:hypothetical protein|tara:strand:- start:56 stop:268 length:213 start_codon:yes stop_codon:yes gene_type:complete
MDIDVVWVAVSVYMIVLVVYGSYLLRGWIRMRREHRNAWKRYCESQELMDLHEEQGELLKSLDKNRGEDQ